jgi:DNA-binding response OmpR family regulator
MDLVEIDSVIKTAWSGSYLVDRRINKDRRITVDRRQNHYHHNGEGHHGLDTRQTERLPHDEGKLDALGFHVDVRQKCLFIKGHKIDLTPKEFELIEYLSTDPDRIFTPDEIVKHLWPENHRATKSDLYQYIHLLRKKIEKDHNQPQLILNAKGFGYKLNVLSRQASAASFASPGQNTGRVTQMEPLQTFTALS